MNKTNIVLDKIKWLKEGFILQKSRREYWLGQGPFTYSTKAEPQSLYHPVFFLNNKRPWLKPSFVCSVNKEKLADLLVEKNMDQASHNLEKFFKYSNKPSFIKYQKIFFQVQQDIRKGLIKKVVPAFCESFSLKPKLLFLLQNIFKKIQNRNHGFLYGVWNEKSGVLGFTPELLFSLKGEQFLTMALAGTGLHPGPSLLKDEKELKEHNFVIQNIQESLKGLAKFNTIMTCEKLFPPLKHLYTEFKGQLTQRFDFESICKILHPTAALGGYPKKQVVNWMKNQSSQKNRKFFGAPFGFFNSNKEAICLVALRALEWDEEKSMIFSGGGLIKESSLQKEWRELYLKREQVKSFFIP